MLDIHPVLRYEWRRELPRGSGFQPRPLGATSRVTSLEHMTMTGQWSRDAGTPPFVDLVPIERATGARKELYDEMERVRGPGRVSNLFKAYAAFPALAKANFHR